VLRWNQGDHPARRRARLATTLAVGTLVAWTCLGQACLPGRGPPLDLAEPDAAPPPPTVLSNDAGLTFADVDLGASFAVVGLAPSHGPFTGGTRTVLSGRGFPSNVQVFIGGAEISSSNVVASDATQAAVITPPGVPGPAAVKIVNPNNAETATLAGGFTYDAFVLTPNTGATSGGTRVAFQGSDTSWVTGTKVLFAGVPCTSVAVADAMHMLCTTPAAAAATVDVDVITPDGVDTKTRDAYTYSDSPDGYRGGLAGGALSGSLTVLAFDQYQGTPISGAHVIVGGVISTAMVQSTDSMGTAQFSGPSLTGKVTVTVAAKCHSPMTFVDVPVSSVTAYLVPMLDPACGSGDPPSTGNYTQAAGGQIDGQLVWGSTVEFERGGWSNVPNPQRATERQAAYVFLANAPPTAAFSLPDPTTATTPNSPGSVGYEYTLNAAPGNLNVYALAGIEDRSLTPPVFTAYVMGVARGVPVQPSTEVTGVDIPMTTLLDQGVTFAPTPPGPGAQGPNLLNVELAVSLDETTYAILPNGQQSLPLPVSGNVSFIGVPALDNALAGQSYVFSAAAVTGPSASIPSSQVALVETTNADTPVSVGGFLAVPTVLQPSAGAWAGTQVSIGEASSFDLLELTVSSGLVTWTIVAPKGDTSFSVPDLSGFSDAVGLPHGPLQTVVYVASIASFQYGELVTGQLSTGAWNAYAANSIAGVY